MSAPTREQPKVQFCPFCGSQDIVREMVEWYATSLESGDLHNDAHVWESQCRECSRSFWA